MEPKKDNKPVKFMLVAMMVLVSGLSVFAYPPDNAAVLYYKAFMLYQVDDTMNSMLNDLKGEIEVDEKVKEFVKKNEKVIQILLYASNIDYCDWGVNFNEGYEEEIPHIFKMRELSRPVLAKARILAQEGDYKTALMHCISAYKMGKHTGDLNLISYMVGISVIVSANGCINDILSNMPVDLELLSLLRSELVKIDSIPFSMKSAVAGEYEAGKASMTPDKINYLVQMCIEDDAVKEKILASVAADNQFLADSSQYWNDHMKQVAAACDLPYLQAYLKLEQLSQRPGKEANGSPKANLIAVCAPVFHKAFSLSARLGSHCNAIKAAIEIYMIKAKTGQLPDNLPASLPKDLFSGKDFKYEKKSDGFVLSCQGMDLAKNETYQFEFKVK